MINDVTALPDNGYSAIIHGQRVYGLRLDADGEQHRMLQEWAATNALPVYAPPPPSAGDVIAERTRRLALGFDFDFGDARGVHHIGTTVEDMVGWDEVAKGSQALIAIGSGSTEITIVTNTGPAAVTALEFQEMLAAATMHRQPIWAASFALQAMDPIPADYTDDSYWL